MAISPPPTFEDMSKILIKNARKMAGYPFLPYHFKLSVLLHLIKFCLAPPLETRLIDIVNLDCVQYATGLIM